MYSRYSLLVPVWCCAHSAQCCHLFLLTFINGKKPPWLLLATCYPRRKQHGGLSLTGLCCWSNWPWSELWRPCTACRPGPPTTQEEARRLQVWQNTGRGLLLNGMQLDLLFMPSSYTRVGRCYYMLAFFWLMLLDESSSIHLRWIFI